MKTKNSKTFTIRKQFHFVPGISTMEHGDPLSQTVPDQSYTLRELLTKHSKGLPIPAIAKQPIYSEDDLPDFKSMDLTEIQEYRDNLKLVIDQAEQKIHLANKAKEKQAYDEEIERRVNSKLSNETQKTIPDSLPPI